MYLLDHIVHFVKAPEDMVGKTKEIGLHTVEGGRHEVWGTYNSLCYFGLSYIEFIGVYDQSLLDQSATIPYTLHDSYKKRNEKKGFTRIAIRTTSIDDDAKKLKEAGYEVIGPETFSRTRPDGSVLSWKLLHFGKKNLKLDFPFLIQWNDSDEERLMDLRKNGTIKEHPLGDLLVQEVSFHVEDLDVAKAWSNVFEFEIVDHSESYIKIKSPNCQFAFYKENQNDIVEVIIAGAKEEKEVVLEEGKYFFKSE